jgi:hypothetical protein
VAHHWSTGERLLFFAIWIVIAVPVFMIVAMNPHTIPAFVLASLVTYHAVK